MNIRIAIATLAFMALLLAGCSSAPEDTGTDEGDVLAPEGFNPDGADMPSRDWPRKYYYQQALTLMNNAERMEYFRMGTNPRKDLYLRQIGADARVDLQFRLGKMMGDDVVMSDLRSIFAEELWDDAPVRFNLREIWGLKRFNGQGYTHMMISLEDGKLVDYGSYSEQQWIENERIYAECSRIEKNLAKIVHVGMPITAIDKTVENFSSNMARVFAATLHQNLERADESWKIKTLRVQYEEQLKPYSIIGEKKNPDAEYSDPVNYYAMKFREPDEKRFEGRRVWWRYDLKYGDRTLWLFFEFRERELREWYCEIAPERVQ